MSPAFVCELLQRGTSVLSPKLSAELEIARSGMPNVRVVASPKGVATSESLAAQLRRDSHVVLPALRSVGRLGMTRNRQCISETPPWVEQSLTGAVCDKLEDGTFIGS